MIDENGLRYEYCLVGNIIDAHYSIARNAILHGSKHFRPGAKVYVLLLYGGMGDEAVQAFGKPRKQFQLIDIVVRCNYVKNFRVQKVYDPKVLAWIDRYYPGRHLTELEWLLERAGSLNRRPTSELRPFPGLDGLHRFRIAQPFHYRPRRLPAPFVYPPWTKAADA